MLHEVERETGVWIPAGTVDLPGILGVPPDARSLVLFAHGSGSSRLSPRNRQVAEALQDAGIATLLFDLLTEAEARDRRNVFDVELLAGRLDAGRRWAETGAGIAHPRLGYFGASTGAAAALVSAAEHPGTVGAIVSRGGRPDLAGEALSRVAVPTLLIVGGADAEVLELNRWALARLPGTTQLSVVPGATHLFAEPGALERVATLAAGWFLAHLRDVGRPEARVTVP
jgi:putative phosphoribosyl transferase